jgi:cytoskeletal protein RodZ
MKKNSLKYFSPLLIAALLIFSGFAIRAQQPQSSDQTDTSTTKSKSKSKKKTSPATDSSGSSNTATTFNSAAQKQTPPANNSDMVSIHPDSRVYHKPGSHWYSKAKHGKYSTEADAQKAGYRPAEKE